MQLDFEMTIKLLTQIALKRRTFIRSRSYVEHRVYCPEAHTHTHTAHRCRLSSAPPDAAGVTVQVSQ